MKTVFLSSVERDAILFSFFFLFWKQGYHWGVGMSISYLENGCSIFAGTTRQQISSKELYLSHVCRTASPHGSATSCWCGKQQPRVKARAEFRSYEEDGFFVSAEAPQPLLSSALSWATAIHQSLTARDARFCLPENGVFQPQLNSASACPMGRRSPPRTAGSSTTCTAGATVTALCSKHVLKPPPTLFCSFCAPSASLCLGFFPWHPVPQPCSLQSAADILDRSSLYVTFVRAVFSHADE